MKTYLEGGDALDGLEFLSMAAAGALAHWEILATLNETAKVAAITKLVSRGVPIEQQHVASVREHSLRLAADEDPSEAAEAGTAAVATDSRSHRRRRRRSDSAFRWVIAASSPQPSNGRNHPPIARSVIVTRVPCSSATRSSSTLATRTGRARTSSKRRRARRRRPRWSCPSIRCAARLGWGLPEPGF
jgi:hypothetical protein